MLGNFSTKELIVCALFGAMVFIEAFVLGSAVIAATGISATGSLLNMLFAVLISVIGIKIVDKFGAATIILTIEGILTVPTLINGPTGIQKILMLFAVGLIVDIILSATKRSNKGFILAGIMAAISAVSLIFLSLVILGLPGASQLQAILIPLIAVNAVLGGLGAYLGLWIYDRKLKDRAFVKQMSKV